MRSPLLSLSDGTSERCSTSLNQRVLGFLCRLAKNEPLLAYEIPAGPGECGEEEGRFSALIQSYRGIVNEAVEYPTSQIDACESNGFAAIEGSMAKREMFVGEEPPN